MIKLGDARNGLAVTSPEGARHWAIAAATAADNLKGVNPLVVDVGDILVVTDYFVITHGNNPRQVRAITEGVEEALHVAGGPAPLAIEGSDEAQWVLLDYGSFVVHVFDAEHRDFYRLEELWGDCDRLRWSQQLPESTVADS